MHGQEERKIPGHNVTIDASKPFQSLKKCGVGFLYKFTCVEVPIPILERVTFIDAPVFYLDKNQDYVAVIVLQKL